MHYTADLLKSGEWLHYDGKTKSPHVRPSQEPIDGELQHALYTFDENQIIVTAE